MNLNNRHIGAVVLAGLWLLVVTSSLAAPQSKTIQGEILRIDGPLYVIKPLSPLAGAEVRLHVDERSVRLTAESFKVGDTIIADVTPDGHAVAISTIPPLEVEVTARPAR